MIKLNGPISKSYADVYKPFSGGNVGAKLYQSDGTRKQIGVTTSGALYQPSPANGDYFIFPIFCIGSETHLDISYVTDTDCGIVDIYVNGVIDTSGLDLYASSSTAPNTAIALTQPIIARWNEIKFVVSGKNASSSDYVAAFKRVALR